MAEGFERLADISRLDEEIRVREEEKAGLPAGRAACAYAAAPGLPPRPPI